MGSQPAVCNASLKRTSSLRVSSVGAPGIARSVLVGLARRLTQAPPGYQGYVPGKKVEPVFGKAAPRPSPAVGGSDAVVSGGSSHRVTTAQGYVAHTRGRI